MSCKKKELEIIYNLNWKNRPKREDEQMSIIAVYDIPSTTLNFEAFKSYLLKNSGTSENDVKVSYILDSGKEYPIQSQLDFQVALYAFRAKARHGEVINLMLEKISNYPIGKNQRHSNDAETQFDTMNSTSLTCNCNLESAPEWFLNSISQLKKEITEDITAALTSVISTAVANVKPQLPTPPPQFHHYSRKCKPDKRIRKGPAAHVPENSSEAKDLLKSIKLDYKLEKLERKASKYREKRFSLQSTVKSSDSEAGHSSSRSRSRDKQEETKEPRMDAMPINDQKIVPHMLGGEIYLHQWKVQNTGEGTWNAKTKLQYTWGSKALVPLSKVVSVPSLKPGEKATICVRFQIPTESGAYECYWQFMHNQRRFGHWLGCQVIVDPFDLKGNSSVLETTAAVHPPPRPLPTSSPIIPDEAVALKIDVDDFFRGPSTSTKKDPTSSAEVLASFFQTLQNEQQTNNAGTGQATNEELLREVSDNVQKIQFDENGDSDSNSSEDENFSLLGDSASSKNSFKDEFVVVPEVIKVGPFSPFAYEDIESAKPKCSQSALDLDKASTASLKSTASHSLKETQSNSFDDNNNASASSGNSIKLRDEDLDNVVVITVPKDEQGKEGYIYVHVDGQKVLVPKNILKCEVVNAAISLETQPGEKKSVGVVIGPEEALDKSIKKEEVPVKQEEIPVKVEVSQADGDSGNVLDGAAAAKPKPVQEQCFYEPSTDLTSFKATYGSQSDLRSDIFEEASQQLVSGSCFSSVNDGTRVFVFPPNGPGYEAINVVQEPVVTPQVEPNVPLEHVPNFQQTPPEERPVLREAVPVPRQEDVHILPEALLNGAASVASSAISTARSVLNMIKPQPPGPCATPLRWESHEPQTPREANLHALAEMGFWNRDLNITLLDRYSDDLNRVVADLVQ